MIEPASKQSGDGPGSDVAPAGAHQAKRPAQIDGQPPPGRQWTSSLPQVASEDTIHIGNGRYAHFRRDRRFAQVQVAFTAPTGVDPDPGRELTDQFKELGWTWRRKEPGQPWIYPLDKSSEGDLTARGDSRDVLHEQFLLIIQEYRQKHGTPPTPARKSVSDAALTIREKQIPRSADQETRAGGQAADMLHAFASVGAERFDLTLTDAAGTKVRFQGNRPLDQLLPAMVAMLQEAADRHHNIIVRPRSRDTTLIQLDDLDDVAANRVKPVSFLILCTSPRSYQLVAVNDADPDFARRLRRGIGADLTASGATRVSGSMNFKEKYAPAFPRVETVCTHPGLNVTRAELEALGLVASPERTKPAAPATRVLPRRTGARAWPSYQRCVEHAPPAQGGGRPDISRADFTFCLLAIDWGYSVEEIAARLMQESSKARENGEAYALRTARNAAAAVERRGERQR